MPLTSEVTDAEGRAGGSAHQQQSAVAERTGAKALLSGGTVLAVAMMAANGGNYLLNLLLGRWLSPAEFADANLMVTLMLLVTAIAVALQLVSARYAGIHQARGTDERADAVEAWLVRVARRVGIGLLLLLAVPAAFWADSFRTASPWPFVVLALGMPFYLIQAVGRGMLQGRLRFWRLAVTFLVEMVVRVGVGLALVAAGLGVEGATLGLTISFVATWAMVRGLHRRTSSPELSAIELGDLRAYINPVLVLLAGQIIINNGDVLIIKSSFPPDEAGVYAAIALIGRAVFFLSWSAVTTLFPAVAQREESGHESSGLLLGGVAVVTVACGGMIAAVALGGDQLFSSVFGPEYAGVNHLLVRYAIATSLFAVANLIVTHQLSAGQTRAPRLLVGGAVFQTGLLLIFHNSAETVVWDQMIAMAALLLVVACSTALSTRTDQ